MATNNNGQHAIKKGRKSGGPWRVVFILSLIVLTVCLCALALIGLSYCQGQQKYDSLAKTTGISDISEDADIRELKVDWDALKASNPDIVGWVYIPNTVINDPIVQASDNDYYLGHDFDGDEGWLAEFGTIFLDYRNASDWSDASNFVYGHHLNDGSMFASIGEMDSQKRFEECRTVFLLTPQGNYKLRAYSLIHCPGTEAIVETEFESPEAMASYVQDMINHSEFDPGNIPAAKEIKKSFAFATCDNTYQSIGRYVLFCYVVDKNAEDLSGNVGISANESGEAGGFVNDLEQETRGAGGLAENTEQDDANEPDETTQEEG